MLQSSSENMYKLLHDFINTNSRISYAFFNIHTIKYPTRYLTNPTQARPTYHSIHPSVHGVDIINAQETAQTMRTQRECACVRMKKRSARKWCSCFTYTTDLTMSDKEESELRQRAGKGNEITPDDVDDKSKEKEKEKTVDAEEYKPKTKKRVRQPDEPIFINKKGTTHLFPRLFFPFFNHSLTIICS